MPSERWLKPAGRMTTPSCAMAPPGAKGTACGIRAATKDSGSTAKPSDRMPFNELSGSLLTPNARENMKTEPNIMVSSADWDNQTVYVSGSAIGHPGRVTLSELRSAASQDDREIASVYRDVERRAREALEAARKAKEAARAKRIEQCSGHRAAGSEDRCFCVPVSHPIAYEPRAHGNITRTEWCRCGATRQLNINQQWVEEGRWH